MLDGIYAGSCGIPVGKTETDSVDSKDNNYMKLKQGIIQQLYGV